MRRRVWAQADLLGKLVLLGLKSSRSNAKYPFWRRSCFFVIFFGDDVVQMSDLEIFFSPFSEMFMWVNSIGILWVRLSG